MEDALGIRVRQAKQTLMAAANKWIADNDSEALLKRPAHRWRARRILELTRDVSGKVLDIGCFTGSISEKVARQGNKEVTGVDTLDYALAATQKKGIPILRADIEEGIPDIADNEFDCVLLTDTLQHVFDPHTVVGEAFRVLRPGGKLIVTVPNVACIDNRIRLLFGRPPYRMNMGRPEDDFHWKCYTFETLKSILSEHRFRLEKMETDVVLHENSRFMSVGLGRILPTLGRNIIASAVKSP